MYCVLIDANNGFDGVQKVKLFKIFLKRNICPLVT